MLADDILNVDKEYYPHEDSRGSSYAEPKIPCLDEIPESEIDKEVAKAKVKDEGVYILNTLCKKKILTPEQEIGLTKSISDYRKLIFSKLLSYQAVRAKIYQDLDCSLNVIRRCEDRMSLDDIVYLEEGELDKFRKSYMKIQKGKHSGKALSQLVRTTEYKADYYDDIIDVTEKQMPELYEKNKKLSENARHLNQLKEELFYSNIKLIPFVMKRFFGMAKHLTFGDMFQEGSTGLIKAVSKYEHKKNNRFSTYAVWWIRQSMTKAIYDKDNEIRMPVHKYEKFNAFWKASSKLFNELGREPADHEIAQYLGAEVKHVRELRKMLAKPTSLSLSLGEDITLGDILPGDDKDNTEAKATNKIFQEQLMTILANKLTERELYVIKGRFLEDKTLQEIGEEVKLSRERIRQIEAKALRKARYAVLKSKLRDASAFIDDYFPGNGNNGTHE